MFQVLDEVNLIEAAVTQDTVDVEIVSKHHTCLTKKTHCTLPGATIPRAVPYVDDIANFKKASSKNVTYWSFFMGIIIL